MLETLLLIGLLQGFPVPPSAITLDGKRVAVSWSDGDSFQIMEGALKSAKVRLQGYNTLESYGPVHQWGKWRPMGLYKIAKGAAHFARSRVWSCNWGGKKDGYGRLLIRCPDLIEGMVREGWAHLFEIEERPDPKHVAAQAEARKAHRGLWEMGIPRGILTSLHSSDEGKQGDTYNRIADVITGVTHKKKHKEIYSLCQKVCFEGSCMIYVPFAQRYGPDRAGCLKTKGKW